MDNKTPGNIKYGDMPADYRMRYKQMIEKHNKNKDKNKKNRVSRLQRAYGTKSK